MVQHLLQVAVQGVLFYLWEAIFLQPQDQLRLLVRLEGQQVYKALPERSVLSAAFLLHTARNDYGPRRPPQRSDVRQARCRFPDLDLLP